MKYEKLVRDNIPTILDEKGIPYEKRTANEEEYRLELIKKLSEEVGEFEEAGDLGELADVLEVIEAIKQLPEYNDVERIRLNKLAEKGGFKNKLILRGEKD